MMKKLAFFSLSAIALGLFSGCGSSEPAVGPAAETPADAELTNEISNSGISTEDYLRGGTPNATGGTGSQ